MKIFNSPKFERSFRKLVTALAEKVTERILLFEKNSFDPRLETHKLHGKLKDKWSFSIDKRCRVLFEFDNSDVVLLDVDDHDLYK